MLVARPNLPLLFVDSPDLRNYEGGRDCIWRLPRTQRLGCSYNPAQDVLLLSSQGYFHRASFDDLLELSNRELPQLTIRIILQRFEMDRVQLATFSWLLQLSCSSGIPWNWTLAVVVSGDLSWLPSWLLSRWERYKRWAVVKEAQNSLGNAVAAEHLSRGSGLQDRYC